MKETRVQRSRNRTCMIFRTHTPKNTLPLENAQSPRQRATLKKNITSPEFYATSSALHQPPRKYKPKKTHKPDKHNLHINTISTKHSCPLIDTNNRGNLAGRSLTAKHVGVPPAELEESTQTTRQSRWNIHAEPSAPERTTEPRMQNAP